MYWRRNVGSTRKPVWKPLCTFKRIGKKFNYDLHWLDPYSSKDGLDGVAFYVSKYCLKYDSWIQRFKSKLFFNLPFDKFKEAWSLLRPRVLLSKGFGSPTDPDVISHIDKGVKLSLVTPTALYPYFVSRVNGSTFPLAPYYCKKLLTLDSKLVFWSRRPEFSDEVTIYDIDDFDKRENQLSEVQSYLNSINLNIDFDDIDDINSTYYDYGQIPRNPQTYSDFADGWQDFDDSDYSYG